MARGLRPHLVGGLARVNQVLHHAVFNDGDALAGNAFAVKRSSGLGGVENIVAETDVFAKNLLPYPAGKATPLLMHRQPAEIENQEAQQVENGRGLEDDGVFPRLNLPRLAAVERFLSGPLGQFLRLQLGPVGGSLLGPARTFLAHHGDGEFRLRLLMEGGRPRELKSP